MDREELNKIAKVIHNKIYNENIRVYEAVAYEGCEYNNKILSENQIAISDIEKSIMNKEDLNQINGLSMQNYTNIDLNVFFTKVKTIREKEIKIYERMIVIASIDSIIFWLGDVLDSFTYEESFPIKKAFLEKTLNFCITDVMTSERIDYLFWTIFYELTIQKVQKKARKLVQ